MALTTYAELLDAVIRWSGYGNGVAVPAHVSAAAADAIAMAENDINDLLRTPEQIVRSLFSASTEFVSAPPAMVKLIGLSRLKNGLEYPLRQVAEDVIPTYARAYAGDQEWFALVGQEFRFAPAPTSAAPMDCRLVYYGAVDPLSGTSPCTATFGRYPNVYLYGAMKHISLYLEDAAGQTKWADMQAREIVKANRTSALRDASL